MGEDFAAVSGRRQVAARRLHDQVGDRQRDRGRQRERPRPRQLRFHGAGEEADHPLDRVGPVQPPPVAGVGQLEQLRGGQRARVLGGEAGGDVGVLQAPHHQRGHLQPVKLGARPGEHLGRGAAIQPQDRALGAVVEVVEHRVQPGIGQRTRGGVGVERGAAQRVARGGTHRDLPQQRRAPQARGAVPAVAGEERYGVHHHQPLDSLGVALGEGQPHRAPVVHDQPHALDLEQVEVLLDEARIPVDRVVEVPGLAGAPEAGKVGREPPAAFQEPRPRLSRAPR